MLKGKGKKAEVYYYQLDHLGTPQELTAANGQIAWSAKYKAYGNLALQQQLEGIEQPLRFQGQYHDLETGLYYNRNRYYAPETGRYITPDPIKLAGGLNNYQYCNNPINWVDPLGLNGECPGTNVKAPTYKNKPDDIDGKINIGAGETPREGYYNMDMNPKAEGVYKGDGMSMPEVKTGSQSKVNIENPYGYDPLNSETVRILSDNGQIRMVGNENANKYFRNAYNQDNLDRLQLHIVSKNQVPVGDHKLSGGTPLKSKNPLTEVILEKN